jgi:hypothetical protein
MSFKATKGSRQALLWLVVFAIAMAVGMYASGPSGEPRGFPRIPVPPDLRTLLFMLGVGSPVWYAVFIALPLLLFTARRIDIAQHTSWRTAAIGITAMTVLIALTSYVQYTVTYMGAPSRPDFVQYLPVALRSNILPWIALAGVVIAVESRRRAVLLAVEQERLRSGMAEQRLVALTSQLQPHFLFNTLQGISTLIHRDPDAADQMLGKLADLLRNVLRDRDRVLIPLGEEIEYARTYLEISKLRFGERLSYHIEIPAELERIEVPTFIFQPLVENALAHGIASRIQGGRVVIRAAREGDRLRLEVEDDGGALTLPPKGEGVGLTNTRERLRTSFGDAASFDLLASAGRTIASVVLPATRKTRPSDT